MFHIKKSQWPILIVNLIAFAIFTTAFLSRENYEFVIYVFVILFFLLLILATNKKVEYPNDVLWGLTAWAILHMGGGGISIGGTRLYDLILIPISSTYEVLKYDQFVHMVGFFVTTLVVFHVLRPLLKPDLDKWWALSIVVVMAGLGFGALNEIVESSATVFAPETGVGGYINTSLDLVSNFIGAILAMVLIRIRRKKPGD